MTFTVENNINAALASIIANRCERAAHTVALQVKKDTEPYVPMLTGSLKNRARVDGNTIIYPGPYARFLYYGKVMVDPNTGSTWAPMGGTKVVTDRDLIFTTDFHPLAQSHWFEAAKAQNEDKWLRVAQKAVEHFG